MTGALGFSQRLLAARNYSLAWTSRKHIPSLMRTNPPGEGASPGPTPAGPFGVSRENTDVLEEQRRSRLLELSG